MYLEFFFLEMSSFSNESDQENNSNELEDDLDPDNYNLSFTSETTYYSTSKIKNIVIIALSSSVSEKSELGVSPKNSAITGFFINSSLSF